MLRICLVMVLMFIRATSFCQNVHVGIFTGFAAYEGDLTDKLFPKKVTNGAIGVTASYELMDQFLVRGGLTYSVVGGADRFSADTALQARNLAFETKIVELSLLGEYYLFNLYDRRFSPYVFAGLAVYHFNPYAYGGGPDKIFLKPLSTEGQGLSQYPDRKPYSLTQLALPFGGGIKYAFSEKVRLGLEMGLRKLFTDYLDDVSTSYVDENDLRTARGQLAVDMSYRGDELPNGNPNYPTKSTQRGGAKYKDWYYFFGLHLTFRILDGNNSNRSGVFGGGNYPSRRKKGYGCPANPR
jgi:Domain of unknown function (DUF6089)